MSAIARTVATILFAASSLPAAAAVKTRTVEYRQGEAVLEGYMAWDDAATGKRPGVLVVHEWTGINPYTRKRVEQLASLGFVAFAADIYGKGIRPTAQADAAAAAGKYKGDRPLLRARINAALTELRKQAGVDTAKVAAIG